MMKLKDLVVNSLPRVRGRKKKAAPAVTPEAPKLEPLMALPALDHNANGHPARGSRKERKDGLETHDILETSWRGNALYRGLETHRAYTEYAPRLVMYSDGYGGIVTSHSAEGFSTHVTLPSRGYDAPRMAVSDFNGSCSSQMSSISETGDALDPYSYHCHYHRHSHQHHYHHHHMHGKPIAPVAQNQQDSTACKAPSSPKPNAKRETNFFKKSFASLKGRKQCSKANRDTTELKPVEQPRCLICPYPNEVTVEQKSSEKRPTKPKRKGLKNLSRSKENKDFKDKNLDHQTVTYSPCLHGSCSADMNTVDRPRFRECSVESCLSRLYSGSREGSSVRDIDLTGFDSASLSGYESDLPRSKNHRSRSRIKTNPWLPSPQPSLSGRRCDGDNLDLRESREDIADLNETSNKFPRSASFELQRNDMLVSMTSSWNDIGDKMAATTVQRHRSLTPLDINVNFGLETSKRSLLECRWPKLVTESQAAPKTKSTAHPKLNDLNCERIRPRALSPQVVSPNSEFVMLADNLEQLANNISFEYEDMLDCTLESASLIQEDGDVSIKELTADEENGAAGAQVNGSGFMNSVLSNQSAHSPDSGLGGMASSEPDDALVSTPDGYLDDDAKTITDESPNQRYYSSSSPHETFDDQVKFRSEHNSFLSAVKLVSQNTNTQCAQIRSGVSRHDAVSISDADHNTADMRTGNMEIMSPVYCAANENQNGQGRSSKLMVSERLDISFHPAHSRFFHGACNNTGSSKSIQEQPQKINGMVITNRFSDPLDSGVMRRLTRPSVLAPRVRMTQLNDMEKSTAVRSPQRDDDIAFPRNIPSTDCVESPTENWQCDWQHGCQDQSDDSLPISAVLEESINMISTLPRENATNGCHKKPEKRQLFSEASSQPEGLEIQTDFNNGDTSFDVSDASVQTDFEDDFSKWEEAELLGNMSDTTPLDAAERTRLWFLTGNMQDSADTGYSSLTRDSQIFMDEDSLFLTGEFEEKVASERLSLPDIPCPGSCIHSSPPGLLAIDVAVEKVKHFGDVSQNETGAGASSNKMVIKFKDSASHLVAAPDVGGHPLVQRTIPRETVNQMFSTIEQQFQEIFQQIQEHEHRANCKTMTPNSGKLHRRMSDIVSNSPTNQKRMTDAETGENRNAAIDVNITPNRRLQHSTWNEAKYQILNDRTENDVTSDHRESISERSAEKADYLEFLKDAPLRRSHLKRPFFLVPGVGPVDMSSTEQMTMFSEADPSVQAPTINLSPLSRHSGKKQKVKKHESLVAPPAESKRQNIEPKSVKARNDAGHEQGSSVSKSSSSNMFVGRLQFRNDVRDPFISPSETDTSLTSQSRSKEATESFAATGTDADSIRNLAARVVSLRQEKEKVFQKIQEAQQDEVSRQQQRSMLEQSIHAKRKEALLESLRDLRARLEEQKRKLKQ